VVGRCPGTKKEGINPLVNKVMGRREDTECGVCVRLMIRSNNNEVDALMWHICRMSFHEGGFVTLVGYVRFVMGWGDV